jgi:3-oxoacyl-[acyl-carrier protein] reductase
MAGTARVAVITGGTRGMGRRVAERLVAQGYAIVVNFVKDSDSAATAVEELACRGAQVVAHQADIADEVQVAELFDEAERTFGGVDVLVNAAGIIGTSAPVADLELTVLDEIMRTNVRGAFVVNQRAARCLRSGGAIINFSSSATRLCRAGSAAYTMSKGAVESLALLLARELRGRDITVNTVAPGVVATSLFERFLEGRPQVRAELISMSPMDRLGTPDDIAEVVGFLAGPGRWVNGQTVYVNGGAA